MAPTPFMEEYWLLGLANMINDHPDYQHQPIYLSQEFVLSTEKLKLKLDPYNIFDIHIEIFVAFIISK